MNKQIFILEDNPDISYVLDVFLTTKGYEVSMFSTISQLQDSFQQKLPDVFLLDVMLPDGNGFSICEQIKQDARAAHIPVVMMSAHFDLELMPEVCAADDFIAKPFDLDVVSTRLNNALKN